MLSLHQGGDHMVGPGNNMQVARLWRCRCHWFGILLPRHHCQRNPPPQRFFMMDGLSTTVVDMRVLMPCADHRMHQEFKVVRTPTTRSSAQVLGAVVNSCPKTGTNKSSRFGMRVSPPHTVFDARRIHFYLRRTPRLTYHKKQVWRLDRRPVVIPKL